MQNPRGSAHSSAMKSCKSISRLEVSAGEENSTVQWRVRALSSRSRKKGAKHFRNFRENNGGKLRFQSHPMSSCRCATRLIESRGRDERKRETEGERKGEIGAGFCRGTDGGEEATHAGGA